MNQLFLILLCAFVSLRAAAQVRVEILSDQITFLPYEDLPITVRIINFSGQDLMLGQDDEWLKFSVQARDGFIVPKLSNVPVRTPFTVKSSEVGIRRVDLAPHFDLSRPGRYQIVANVKIPGWERDFQSLPKDIDITSGAVIWQQEFGVPGTGNPGGAPEVRKYALVQSNQLKETRLYLKLTDATGGVIYRIFPIGSLVSFGNPDKQIDVNGCLHVLHQYSARLFNYCVIKPNGQLQSRESYEITGSRPTLRNAENGSVQVIGGMLKQIPREAPLYPGSPAEEYRQGADQSAHAPVAPPATETKPAKEKKGKTSTKADKKKSESPKP